MKTLQLLVATSLCLSGLAIADDPLPQARDSFEIRLEDGDTYQLRVRVVEKQLNGVPIRMYSYAGAVPGPLIRVAQGATIKLILINESDLPTTLHSHGVRLANAFDGVPGVTQDPIQPGERFTYTIKFPDAGCYWYHPHVQGWYTQELGLYGVFLVEPTEPNYYGPANREKVLVLDDILVDEKGVPVVRADEVSHALMGSYGNLMLINGSADYRLRVRRGEVVRLHLVNTASARPFKIALPGARMKLVAGDAGRFEREQWVDHVVLSPSERVSVDVLFPRVGVVPILNDKPTGAVQLGRIEVSPAAASPSLAKAFSKLRENQTVIAEIDPFRSLFEREPDKRLVLSVEIKSDMGGMDHGMDPMDSDDSMGGMDHSMEPMNMEEGMPGMKPQARQQKGMLQAMDPGAGMPMAMDAGADMPMDPGADMPMAMDAGADMPMDPGADMPMEDGADMSMDHGSSDGIEWDDDMPGMANMTAESVRWKIIDAETGAENKDIDWAFKVGDAPVIEIYNDPDSPHPMQHPMHFHGQRFLVFWANGKRIENLAWKDTVLVPVGSRVRLVLAVTNPGKWLAHCHILEHAAAGMKIIFDVIEEDAREQESTTLPS